MKRRDLIKSIAMTAFGAGSMMFTANAAAETVRAAGTGMRELAVGETVRFDKTLRVTFLKVSKDSRCPINARCITAGDAEVLLEVKVGANQPEIVTLHTHDDPRYAVFSALPDGMIGIPKSYTVRLRKLTPQPIAGKKTRQRDYRLTLGFSIAW
jgi:hypothetical protein